jgi:transposase
VARFGYDGGGHLGRYYPPSETLESATKVELIFGAFFRKRVIVFFAYFDVFQYLCISKSKNKPADFEATLQIINSQQEQIMQLQDINAEQAKIIQELRAQIAWLKRQLFGRKSEKFAHLDPNQLRLFENGLEQVSQQARIEEARAEAVNEIERHKVDKKVERRNRKLLEDLPVVQEIIEPDNIDLERYKRIGEECTRSLEFEPGRLYVREIVRPKYGLKDSCALPNPGESAVMIAPLPLLPIHKALPGASLLAEILLQKYEYHVPFYRQIQVFRHLGLKIPENTLSGWFKPACELLEPLYEALKEQVLGSDYLQVDETTLPVINKQSKQAKKEYLWIVRAPAEGLLFFHYDEGSRSGKTIEKLLKNFNGYLQTDGYSAYNAFEGNASVCLVACMAHIRRKYEQALNEHNSLAKQALAQIQQLYQVERQAQEENLSDEQRKELRQKLALPVFNAFEKWMEKNYPTVLPKSLIGKAIAYSYSLWARMKNYLKDRRLNIDNNGVENAIRPIALSRKNFLFCGNHNAAKNTAIICSLLASCKAQGINPREYLNDILAKLPYYTKPKSKKNLTELLPNRWKNANGF